MDQPAVYGLSNRARCLTAVTGDSERNRFLVGTFSLKENEIHLIEVVDNETELLNIFSHPSEVWSLSPCPFDPSMLFSCHNPVTTQGASLKATLWRMKEADSTLEEILELKGHAGTVKRVLWNNQPDSDQEKIFSLDDHSIKMWRIREGKASEVSTIPFGNVRKMTGAVLDPHFPNKLATTLDSKICCWDLKSNSKAFCIDSAHTPYVRDIDFNPNKPYFFVSGGDDCKVKFWDYRKLEQPVKVFDGHSHWVWNVKYNSFCDQLVVSSSTDGLINLWNAYSISSASSILPVENNEARMAQEDFLIKTFDEHEDSVYSIGWSNCHRWSFASLSHDGRVVINSVPQDLTYKILLSKEAGSATIV